VQFSVWLIGNNQLQFNSSVRMFNNFRGHLEIITLLGW